MCPQPSPGNEERMKELITTDCYQDQESSALSKSSVSFVFSLREGRAKQ